MAINGRVCKTISIKKEISNDGFQYIPPGCIHVGFPLAPRSSRTTSVSIHYAVIKMKILLPVCCLETIKNARSLY